MFHAAFQVNPKDTTAKRNDKNVELRCQPSSNQDFIIWEIFLDNGTYWTVTGSDTAHQLSRLVFIARQALSVHSSIIINKISSFIVIFFSLEAMSLCLSLDC